MGNDISARLFKEAQRLIPGGVNSPVRAFGSVGGTPIFVASGKGSRILDVDGNSYIDMVCSWGPLILGHQSKDVRAAIEEALDSGWTFGAPTQAEVGLARLITEMVPSIEQVRMVNSGTEATLSAIRLARGYTGRSMIVKFIGCYHGHHDALLVAAGSGLATMGIPSSPGVTPGTTSDTLLCRYNDADALNQLMEEHGDKVACIIVEPIAGNMGVVPPRTGFLESVRSACDRAGALLIFDEVITGFRVAPGGAQEILGVMPDLTTLGKIIGGGMPVGAYGGRAEIMSQVAPAGHVYQAGTLSGNPAAMAAGIATLTALKDGRVYQHIDRLAAIIEDELAATLEKHRSHITLQRFGSMFTLFFAPGPITNFEDAEKCDTDRYARYFHALLKRGLYPPPSQFETCFVSAAHDEDDVRAIAGGIRESIDEVLAN